MNAVAARKSRRLESSELRRRLLVIELGSSSVAQFGAGDFDETVAIPQLQGEPPLVFMQRVLERIAVVEQSGGTFDSAVLMTGDRHDAPTRTARRLFVSWLTAQTCAVGELSDLMVDANASAGPEERQELLEMVDELLARSDPRQPLPIRLRFNERSASC